MRLPSCPSTWAGLRVIILLGLSCPGVPSHGLAPVLYCPAYFESIPTKPARLELFPISGQAITVALPVGLPGDFRLIEFSQDGKSIYGQRVDSWDGITRIDFNPPRRSIVRGSVGVGTIGSLVVLPSGKVRVSGFGTEAGVVE